METAKGQISSQRELNRILKKSFRGGRSGLAALLDTALFGAVLFAAVYVCVRPHFRNPLIARTVTVFSFASIVSLWIAVHRLRLDRHVGVIKKQAADELRRLMILTDPERLYALFEESERLCLIRKTDMLTADDVLSSLNGRRGELTIVTLAKPTPAAQELLSSPGINAKLEDPSVSRKEELYALYPVTDETIDEYLIKKDAKSKRKPELPKLFSQLTRERALKYAAVGGVLLLMSFFMRYSLYYRSAAALALSIGAGVFCADEIKRRSSMS